MTDTTSLRHIPQSSLFRKGDVFVLFGELFGRGYVNGLIDEARAAGMTIVGITIGRRERGQRRRQQGPADRRQDEAQPSKE